MGKWFTQDTLNEARKTGSAECAAAPMHEQISATMPFCRHCGQPMPADS